MNPILIPIFLPIIAAVIIPLLEKKLPWVKQLLTVAVSIVCFVVAVSLFNVDAIVSAPWANFGFDFTLRVYPFSAFVLCAIAGFAVLVSVYSWVFMANKPNLQWFYFNYLITLGFASGAVLSENLVLMLFFWEGLLISLYLFLALARNTAESKATALKAFFINGIGDLALLCGIGIVGYLSGSMDMSLISNDKIPVTGWGAAAFLLMMAGAIAKAGSLPFHTWIPDAATDSQLPFMAYLPAALEKLLGIYLLARITLDLFAVQGSLAMQLTLMTIGAVTILVAVMMALVQSDYKKLLSYHAISQVGYMILGIGTCNPIGIAGGIFHMVNHAVYKSCLFLTGGSVEHRTGTTSIYELGGLAGKMPFTATCFIIAAAAISGIAPLNGFFSKELIYSGTLSTGYKIFFFAAELGSLLTLASFLKLGHAVYFGKRSEKLENVKESPWQMLLPMGILAGICVAFGFGAKLPLTTFIAPSLVGTFAETSEQLYGFHANGLFLLSLGVIAIALLNHFYGVKKSQSTHHAADHICKAPVLGEIYGLAEKRVFDPYEQGVKGLFFAGRGLFVVDRIFDFLTDTLPTSVTGFFSSAVSKAHNGLYSNYLAWSVLGLIVYALIVYYGGVMP